MKKFFSLLLIGMMLVSQLTVGASAAPSTSPDAGKVLNAAYGTAEIDGKLDDAYTKGDKITSWVHNTYEALKDKKDQVECDFYAYLMYDESNIYIFGEVYDKTPVTAANALKKTHLTDCIEFYIYMHDLTAAGDVKVYSKDLTDVGAGYLRIHPTEVCPADDELMNNHWMANSGLGLALAGEEVKSSLSRVKTDTGYIVECSIGIPETVKTEVVSGKEIGFGIQVNDDIDDNNTRDALLWSNNNLGDNPKCGPFMLLAKDAAPAETTTAPAETTAAPTTTAAPAVTTAPTTTPATADSTVVVAGMLVMAAALPLALRKKSAK